jgi:hypothetical protein
VCEGRAMSRILPITVTKLFHPFFPILRKV